MEINQWINGMMNFRFPKWDELPDFDIYMDQLTELLTQYLHPLLGDDEKKIVVTPTMINNYVKQNLILKPEKKRYNRQHVASIIAITILKRIFTISEVHLGVESQVEKYGAEQAYTRFCTVTEHSIQVVMQRMTGKTSDELLPQGLSGDLLLLHMASSSFVCQITTEKYLGIKKAIGEKNNE